MSRLRPSRQARILAAIILFLVLAWDISALAGHAGLVRELKTTIRSQKSDIAKLKKAQKSELDYRDTQLETLKNKLILNEKNREIDKIVLDFILAEQARINKRQEEIMGGKKP